jgi:gp16 family phage-associated protein
MDSPAAKDEGNRGRRAAPRPDRARIDALRASMSASGKTVAQLAEEIGEDVFNVHKVLSGTRAATRGAAHRIALKLKLKDAPAIVGESASSSMAAAR